MLAGALFPFSPGKGEESTTEAEFTRPFMCGRNRPLYDRLTADRHRSPGNPDANGLFPVVGLIWAVAIAIVMVRNPALTSHRQPAGAAEGEQAKITGWRIPLGRFSPAG